MNKPAGIRVWYRNLVSVPRALVKPPMRVFPAVPLPSAGEAAAPFSISVRLGTGMAAVIIHTQRDCYAGLRIPIVRPAQLLHR